ncbi:MAG: PaaI family thioesterase [Actinomycetota bacterium]|nr:PaaI family thioesterase [Actinomycetota bacterium]
MSEPVDHEKPRENWGEPQVKTTTWYHPAASIRDRVGLSGIEYLQGILDGSFPPPPIAAVVGAELISFSEGEALFRCRPEPAFLNPLGLVHGGLLCTLMDTAMGVAVQTRVAADVGYATIELKVSFLAPLPDDGRAIDVRGKTQRVGRRIAFAEAHAHAEDGRLVGHATSSLLAMRAD